MTYRINVRNWRGDDGTLQITNGEIVLQSTGKIEDTFETVTEANDTMNAIPLADTYTLSIQETQS